MHSSRSKTPTIPTTWSDWISFFAAAEICAGCVWSYSTNSFNGWPLTPPFALTQLKYAVIMFGPSLKSVPGCLVSIVPMLIGVPVAAWPGLGPHYDVSTDAGRSSSSPADDDELEPPPAAELLELLFELPHPARIAAPTIAAISAAISRVRGECLCILNDLSSSSDPG